MTKNQWIIIIGLAVAVFVMFGMVAYGLFITPNQSQSVVIFPSQTPTLNPTLVQLVQTSQSGLLTSTSIAATYFAGTPIKTSTSTPTPTPAVYPLNTVVAFGAWEYVFTKVEVMKSIGRANAQGIYIVVYFTLKNVSKTAQNPIMQTFEIIDSTGARYPGGFSSYPATTLFQEKGGGLPGSLIPGITVSSLIVFDVNPAATGLRIHPVMTTSNIPTNIYVDLEQALSPTGIAIPTANATPCVSTTQRITNPSSPFNGGKMSPGCSKSFVISVKAGQVLALGYFGYDTQVNGMAVRDPNGRIIEGEGAAGTHYYTATSTGDYTITFQGVGQLIFNIWVQQYH